LRNPRATSAAEELVTGRFEHLIDDASVKDAKRISRLIFCAGKIYYDLLDHRDKTDRDDVALVRIEQLYPLRIESLQPLLKKYARAEKFWVQEEPKNMGAWRYMDATLREKLDLELAYIGREENSSPAVASEKMHRQEQEKIMISAIGLPSEAKRDAAA
jgi:2-oxoglutarate dehydrogenase E1 component